MSKTYVSSVMRHYHRVWGEHAYDASWRKDPAEELLPSFRVLVFEPTRERPLWVYATCGMSDAGDERAIELHLFSPLEYGGHIELLTAVAHYHRTGHPIDVGCTVYFGRGWMPESHLTYGLVSRPYRDGPSLECLSDADDNLLASCYWLLPITKNESTKSGSGWRAWKPYSTSMAFSMPNRSGRPWFNRGHGPWNGSRARTQGDCSMPRPGQQRCP
jgi:hypothetical protein